MTPRNNPEIFAANLAFWREDAVKVNGFDERYVGYGGDDLDFEIRLNRAGVGWRKIRCLCVAYHFTHASRSGDRQAVLELLEEAYRRPSLGPKERRCPRPSARRGAGTD